MRSEAVCLARQMSGRPRTPEMMCGLAVARPSKQFHFSVSESVQGSSRGPERPTSQTVFLSQAAL